ncbi:MAG: terpene synthase [Actinomycetia bacterium]|jgi:hypothetical protein|nr:terpene synthase [Actinomycetes bacterium]MDQ1658466.1 hypothetical protein [Cryptosporangiaceae bacterium]
MDAVLQLVPEAERAAAAASAEWVAAEIADWASSLLGPAAPKLVRNLAYTIAAIAPGLPPDRQAVVARYSAWTFALDDRFDDPGREEAGIRALAEGVAADPVLAPSLAEALAGVVPYASAEAMALIEATVADDVRAGAEHALLSRAVFTGSEPPPSLPDYLDLASRSIGYRTIVLLLLALAECWPADAEQQDTVRDALTAGCRAVRLANDQRSAARHRAEGTLDVLLLATQKEARAMMLASMREHNAIAGTLPVAAASVLLNSLRVSVGLYQSSDLR